MTTRSILMSMISGTVPTAGSQGRHGAMADVDAEYQIIDTTTNTAGEARTVAGVQSKFLRIKFASSTGGAGLTAKLVGWARASPLHKTLFPPKTPAGLCTPEAADPCSTRT